MRIPVHLKWSHDSNHKINTSIWLNSSSHYLMDPADSMLGTTVMNQTGSILGTKKHRTSQWILQTQCWVLDQQWTSLWFLQILCRLLDKHCTSPTIYKLQEEKEISQFSPDNNNSLTAPREHSSWYWHRVMFSISYYH